VGESEADEIEVETQKIIGRLAEDSITAHPVRISVQGMRLPVLDGQMEVVSVELGKRVWAVSRSVPCFQVGPHPSCIVDRPLLLVLLFLSLDDEPRFRCLSPAGVDKR
jgi:aspartate-semialdehyde dehydrogenase